tara:strand:- start:387 stop:878 length:492 start_codon:yes stop_codon:yes gene_type:complete
MKITKTKLQQFINEALKEYSIKGVKYEPMVPEEPTDLLGKLKNVLEKWEKTQYESDTARWQEYAKDIQALIDAEEGEKAPEKHAEDDGRCEEVHPKQSHEEWEASQKEESGEKEEGEKEKSSEKKSSSGSKAKGPKLPPMTYESKLVDAVFGKLVSILPLKEQ